MKSHLTDPKAIPKPWRPNNVWAMAVSSLTRLECDAVRNFFGEAASHFATRLKDMRRNAGDGPHSDEEIDHFVDLREELEAFEQSNRYFAIVQAAGIFERVSVRLIEVAVEAGLLTKSAMYGKSKFVNPRAVNEGFVLLKIGLSKTDETALKELTTKRNLILHSGGRYPRQRDKGTAFEPVKFLKVSDRDVRNAIELSARCAELRIRQFRKLYCERALVL